MSQKASIDDASNVNKKSSLKSTVSAPIAEKPMATVKLEPHSTRRKCSTELLPDPSTTQNYVTVNLLWILAFLLIIALVFLNIYLVLQLYALKHKQADSIHIDRKLLEQLSGYAYLFFSGENQTGIGFDLI